MMAWSFCCGIVGLKAQAQANKLCVRLFGFPLMVSRKVFAWLPPSLRGSKAALCSRAQRGIQALAWMWCFRVKERGANNSMYVCLCEYKQKALEP